MKAAVKLVIVSIFTVVMVAFLAINVSSGSENIERAEKIVEYAETDVVKAEKELAVAWAECLYVGAEVQCRQEDTPGGEAQAAYQKHQEYADQYVADKQVLYGSD